MYSQSEIESALDNHDWLLSEALYKIGRFAESQGLSDLAEWANEELNGYSAGYEISEERPYRVVSGIWKDVYGRPVQMQPEMIIQLGHQPMPMGVQRLEGYSKDGMTLKNPGQIKVLNDWSNGSIDGVSIDGSEIRSLLSRIRMESRRRFHDALPRVPNRSLSYQAPDFMSLVSEPELAKLLGRRWVEANYCFAAAAYLSAVIMLGSILEGVLLSKVQQDPAKAGSSKAAPKDKTGKVFPVQDWKLQSLIDVSHECGWLKKQDKDFSHIIRDYRNYIHPNKELQEGTTFDANTCRIIFEVVIAALS